MKTKEFLVFANWKQYVEDFDVAYNFIERIYVRDDVYIGIAPTFPFIGGLGDLMESKEVGIVSQDVSVDDGGAHTGEVSVSAISSIGVKFCIVGHSEVRAIGESDETISRKVKLLCGKNIIPIVCVGEKERDGTAKFLDDITNQIKHSTKDAGSKKIIIAYEPVWAISGNSSNKIEISDLIKVVSYIEKIVQKLKLNAKIIYGGSVNKDNAKELRDSDSVSGILVGSASADIGKFNEILESL